MELYTADTCDECFGREHIGRCARKGNVCQGLAVVHATSTKPRDKRQEKNRDRTSQRRITIWNGALRRRASESRQGDLRANGLGVRESHGWLPGALRAP